MASIPVSTWAFETMADMRLQAGTNSVPAILLGLNTVNDGNGGTYAWLSTSTGADDGFLTLAVSGVSTGRWIRQLNPNTVKGTKTFSGITLTTSYVISFDTALPIAPAMVIVQAYSNNASAFSYVSNVTTTGFTINFLSVPVVGTNNITVYYLAIKQ